MQQRLTLQYDINVRRIGSLAIKSLTRLLYENSYGARSQNNSDTILRLYQHNGRPDSRSPPIPLRPESLFSSSEAFKITLAL